MFFRCAILPIGVASVTQCANDGVCTPDEVVVGTAMVQNKMSAGSVVMAMDENGEMIRDASLVETISPFAQVGDNLKKLMTDPDFQSKIPEKYKKLLSNPAELAQNPKALLDALTDPDMEPCKEKILDAIKPPLEEAVDKIGPLKTVVAKLGKKPSDLVDELLGCSQKTKCGDCTNKVAPCYWCASTKSCHPVGSEQLGFAQSDSTKCMTTTCQSQWPSSSCKSAYCADGSSVGDDNGPCGGRLNCDACTKGNCFWCGISGSCHQIGSQFFDERCSAANCQSTKWYSSCKSSKCSEATKYEPFSAR